MTTQAQLEKFRENFLLTRVYVEDDWMSYKVKRGFAKSVAEDANELIDRLGLDLVAIVPNNSLAQDVVVVQHQYMQI